MDIDLVGLWADEVGEAVAHIVCGGFGKSKTEDVVWSGVGLLENIGDADG